MSSRATEAAPSTEPPEEDNGKAAERGPAPPEPNPGPSRQQAMLYGIVGDGLKEVTRRVPIDEPPPLGENARLGSIGKAIPRLDAVQKVTGKARFTFDVQLPGMLWGRLVVS